MLGTNDCEKLIEPIIPVILSGGSGSRLWPLSRECHPKQYLYFDQKSKYSLLQNTYIRLIGIENIDSPIIVCNEDQRFLVAEQLRELNIIPKSIILEPIGRNTAPAITLAALSALKGSNDPFLLILSSDHLIKDSAQFREIIKKGISYASAKKLVTFGTIPNRPDTGYGYIESNKEISNDNIAGSIKRFIEKPNKKLAEQFVKNKCFSWNSGIFLFKASTIIDEINKYQPKILEACRKSIIECDQVFNFQRINKEEFKKCPDLPIDIAVMEKTNHGIVLSLNVGWSDIGDWNSLWQNSKKDSEGNVLQGNSIAKESTNSYFRSEERLIVGLGLKDTIVVETNDAVLIANKNYSQSVKNIVSFLKKKNFDEVKYNKKMFRPWGNYTSLINEKKWQVKKLEIKPNASLSLQMHYHRAENWVVVSGTAKVEIDQVVTFLEENESIYVPLGSKHRLSNPNNNTLVIIEVQTGSYLGEDDILRFEDNYGRNKN